MFGMQVPEPPTYDYTVQIILEVFYIAARGRQFIDGVPMPLNARDITNVTEAYDIPIPRNVLDPIVFALDDEYLERSNKIRGKDGG